MRSALAGSLTDPQEQSNGVASTQNVAYSTVSSSFLRISLQATRFSPFSLLTREMKNNTAMALPLPIANNGDKAVPESALACCWLHQVLGVQLWLIGAHSSGSSLHVTHVCSDSGHPYAKKSAILAAEKVASMCRREAITVAFSSLRSTMAPAGISRVANKPKPRFLR